MISLLAHLQRENVTSLEEARTVLARTVADADLAQRLEAMVASMLADWPVEREQPPRRP